MNERKKKPYEQNKRTKSFGRKKKKKASLQKKSKKDKKKWSKTQTSVLLVSFLFSQKNKKGTTGHKKNSEIHKKRKRATGQKKMKFINK